MVVAASTQAFSQMILLSSACPTNWPEVSVATLNAADPAPCIHL